ncbi:MAG: 16S rRNA (guanine(527)-N(7))-methyltransferase RsmG [Deltaproteobacteria bacterium]|nr:16S rRNA (guanine(527)-N(7))-methyltransferase RsmG [Deltaproteobacteria bacterium]
MEYEKFSEVLVRGMLALRLPVLPQEILQKIYKFHLFFLKWNKVINLSAHREEKESLEKNILDSLMLNRFMGFNVNVLDFGSGGGCPGLLLKVCNPHLNLSLVESDRKKAAFLTHVILHLGLKNIQVLTLRINSGNILNIGLNVQAVVSRATMDFEELAGLFLNLLKKGQRITAMVSPRLSEKSLRISKKYSIEFIYAYDLPFSKSPRKIISIVKL